MCWPAACSGCGAGSIEMRTTCATISGLIKAPDREVTGRARHYSDVNVFEGGSSSASVGAGLDDVKARWAARDQPRGRDALGGRGGSQFIGLAMSGSLDWAEGDLVAELVELGDETGLASFGVIVLVEPVAAEFAVGLTGVAMMA